MTKPPRFAAGGHWLLTSASAKVDLARRLRAALNARQLRLFGADASPLSAALYFCDGHFLLPPLDQPGFLEHLLAECRSRDIRVILPSREADLLFFAKHRAEFENVGIWPLLSDLPTLETCLDKIRFHDHCLRHGLPVPVRINTPAAQDFPCFVRRRFGSAGTGAGLVPNLAALLALHGPPPWNDLLIQPPCTDPEYTLDALFDLDGRAVQWIARERIRTKAGESTVGRTVSIPALDEMVSVLASTLHLAGPITIQAFHSPTHGPRLIEINPRFGGAAGLGIEAGLASPERLVALAQGDDAAFRHPRTLRLGLTLLRHTQDLFLPPPSS